MKRSPLHQPHAHISAVSGPFGLNRVTAVVLSVFAVVGGVQSASVSASETANADAAVSFDTTFLRTDPNQTVDVARFARGNSVSPGVYAVDVWVNEIRVSREDVRFVAAREGQGARPCLSRKMLESFGVDFAKVGVDAGAKAGAETTGETTANKSA